MVGGAWWAAAHGVAKSQTRLSDLAAAAAGTQNRRRQWHPTLVLLPGESQGRGAWWAAAHGVAESQTRLSDFTFTFHFHALEKAVAPHSSALAWRIPGTGSLVGCSPWGR